MSPVNLAAAHFTRRVRQIRQIWSSQGPRAVGDRARLFLAERIRPNTVPLPVRPADVLAADLSRRPDVQLPKLEPGEPIILNWVMTPPARGSGGHTTIFRILNYLERNGYANRVYFYDPYEADHEYYEQIVRTYYGFNGPVESVKNPMKDAHGVIATSWPTAYAVFNSTCAGKQFYFVQDFEPFFHPVSAASILAENTYHMGFHAITAGRWLAEKLGKEYGLAADYFEFGCDSSCYMLQPENKRNGIVYYARREARRGLELGIMALELFAKRRPDIEIHIYGDKVGALPFNIIDHGWVTPSQLNGIYNRCFAGLSLSLTNVSLVPHEMLAAGCIPVVNDAEHNRMVLNNPFVHYARPTPQDLATELEALVTHPDFEALARAAAASVRSATWEGAGARVDTALRNAIQSQSMPNNLRIVPMEVSRVKLPEAG